MSTLRRRIIPFALLGTSLATATSFFACGSSPSAETGPSGDAAAPGDSSPQTTADSGSSALDAGTGDATIADGSTGDAGFVQASHLPFPSIVYSGAPLLLAPKVVSIVFKSDPFVTSLEEFGAGITSTTTWWPTVISEYCDGDGGCVGKGPAGVSAEIDASAPAAVYDPSLGPGDAGGAVNIQTFINDLIAAGTVPAPDANTIYALYLPTTTDFNGGGSGCDQGFEGYHSQATYQSADLRLFDQRRVRGDADGRHGHVGPRDRGRIERRHRDGDDRRLLHELQRPQHVGLARRLRQRDRRYV